MNDWSDIFFISIISTALMLSLIGLWFVAVMSGIDRWNKRFFMCYFIVLMLCCFTALTELVFYYNSVSLGAVIIAMVLDSLLLSVPMPMLTVYLLHCLGEEFRSSKLMYIVLGLWTALIFLLVTSPFNGTFSYITPDNHYYRGPLYPLLLLPMIVILLLNLAKAIQCRCLLTRKVFLSFIIVLPIMAAALIVNLFVDAMPLFDISFVISALSMYGLILSDQVDQNQRHLQEIANQRISIMILKMRPHFIYNTLMTIYSLCDQDPQKARQVTMDFTNYLRKNFNAIASENTIPFSAELEHTRAYLTVEQARFEDMLIVDYDTAFTNFRLPPLTLQPLVENAVKHGMDPYSGSLRISIRTRHRERLQSNSFMQDFQEKENPVRPLSGNRRDARAEVIVEDNGHGFDSDETKEPGIAIKNIRQRLEMMCNGSLTITSGDSGGTVVTIMIPDSITQ
jgi:sensor histidine kinase YesM